MVMKKDSGPGLPKPPATPASSPKGKDAGDLPGPNKDLLKKKQ